MSKNNDAITLLEKNFDIAFAAPDGIKKLRELILSLAMQGKLLPQDANDQPASELLKEIMAEKSRLVKDGKIKASKPLPEIKPDEVPYDLLKGWEWVRLGDIIFDAKTGIDKGKEFQSESNEYPYFKMNNISNFGYCDFSNVSRINYEGEDYKKHVLRDGDFLFNTRNSKELVGKTCIFQSPNNELWFFNNNILRIEFFDSIEKYFANFWFLSRLGKIELEKLKSATTNVAAIYQGKLLLFPIPIPSLAEQRRIVSKIDELMARCDELENLKAECNQKQITVHRSTLNRLLIAKDHSEFKTLWRFITQHFGELYSVKENVAELRKAILQLAVMGKLVSQDNNDQPASELLKAIEAEKNRLVKEGKIKKPKLLPVIEDKEISFDLPNSWKWVRLGDITSKITDGDHQTPPRILEGYRLLSAKNVRNGYLDFDNCDFISEENYLKSRERCCPEFNDLLIVSVGGTIGRTSLIPENSFFALVRSVALIKPLLINSSYLKYSMDSRLLQDSIHMRKRGGAQPCLYLSEIEMFPFSLPPLAEQHRIVAKIDQLMTLCDELEKQIDAAESKQTNLLNSMMTKV